jgi:hypothetical protein
MPDPAESKQASKVNELLSCLECGRGWFDDSERWRMYMTGEKQKQNQLLLLLYCTACATREFD